LRKALCPLLALAALACVPDVQAQSYPTRAVTIVVPFAAGGPADITGRIVADQFGRASGQQFLVENVPGAGGTTGTARAARANPDGYTLALGHMGTHAAAVALYPNLAYKPDLGFRADRAHRRAAGAVGGAQRFATKHAAGVRRLCEGE